MIKMLIDYLEEKETAFNHPMYVLNLKGLDKEERRLITSKVMGEIEQVPGLFEQFLSDCNEGTKKYSPRNRVLIQLQHPGASNLEGPKTWNSKFKMIKNGERAIWIKTPRMPTKKQIENGEAEEGEPISYGFAPIFDVSQVRDMTKSEKEEEKKRRDKRGKGKV